MSAPRFGVNVESSYRVLHSSWGIAIDLCGSLVRNVAGKGAKISLQVPQTPILSEAEISFLESGLQRVTPWMESICPDVRFLVVLSSIRFSLSDYQPEGLEPAIMKWASEVSGFAMPPVSVHFNKVSQKYEFQYS